MAKQYHGDDWISVVGGVFVALVQLAVALVQLLVAGVAALVRRVKS